KPQVHSPDVPWLIDSSFALSHAGLLAPPRARRLAIVFAKFLYALWLLCGLLSCMEPHHVPVLADRVLEFLAPAPGQILGDATIGAGGHARLLAERVAPGGRLIGLDQDSAMLALARPRLVGLPVELVHANFDDLHNVLSQLGVTSVDGVLADLGICSDQIDD